MDSPRFTVEKKMEIVLLGLAPRANLDGICERFSISRATFREWKERFLDGARKALQEESRDTREIRTNIEASRQALRRLLGSGDGDETDAS